MMKSIVRWIGIASLAVTSISPASAAIVNGGFESDSPIGWDFFGSVQILPVGQDFGVPPEGIRHALLQSHDNVAYSVPDLENFLQLQLTPLSGLGFSPLSSGSAIAQNISATAGDVLSFRWNFLTNEDFGPTPPPDVDFAFFSLVSESGPVLISSVLDPNLASSLSPYAQETGYQYYEYTIQATGTYRLGFGVIDVDGVVSPSALLLDDVQLTSGSTVIPEPATASVLWLGATLTSAVMWRRRRRSATPAA